MPFWIGHSLNGGLIISKDSALSSNVRLRVDIEHSLKRQ